MTATRALATAARVVENVVSVSRGVMDHIWIPIYIYIYIFNLYNYVYNYSMRVGA